jgi:Kef-type K+ transport system membrane component KefB
LSPDVLVTHVVATCAVVMALSALAGWLFERLHQPRVVGQILAGIALGPSLLGRLPDDVAHAVVPAEVVPYVAMIAQLALVLFLFAVGYELDLTVLRRQRHVVPVVATSAFVVPMLLGAGLALAAEDALAADGGPPQASFVLYVAVAMSITAVPVLAGIASERGISRTRAGVVALASAGLIDAAGWVALVVALLAGSPSHGSSLPVTALLLLVYVVVMLFVARPVLARWLRSRKAVGRADIPVVAVFALGSAGVTAALGLHVIFGAFLAGLVMPRRADGSPDPDVLRPVHEAGSLLLPLFFVIAGLPVDLQGLGSRSMLLLVPVCAVAVLGKLGGGALGARLAGLPGRDSAVVGVLLNTRGLTELIVLNVGLAAALIDRQGYTVLVLMALVTTLLTGPLLDLLRTRGSSPGPTPRRSAPLDADAVVRVGDVRSEGAR